ncbi:MAG TPA: FUSC family protein [Solirubrobacteraceae bacterium]|nr:FUSC family protein [Solirubrobacteraceae bacterium]
MRLSPSVLRHRARRALQIAAHRLRPRLLAILQAAAAAVVAWELAAALLPDPRPAFASIAAVIAVGATFGQRGTRAAELIGGVVVGLSVADIIVRAIGDGPLQMGVMVILAMSTAVVLGGGAMLVVEAAVSALLLAAIDPATTQGAALSPIRFAEALIGGGVALAVTSMFFPPNPVLIAGRAVQAVFAELGRALEQVSDALAGGDAASAERALVAARAIDDRIGALDDAFRAARETARLAPPRRRSREHIDRYGRTLAQIDFAVRNTRVLARNALSFVRGGQPSPELAEAVRELSAAVWELAAAYDEPHRSADVRSAGRRAAARAAAVVGEGAAPALVEIAGHVRSTAVDLVRAADLVADAAPPEEMPTEELLRPTAELRGDPLPAV